MGSERRVPGRRARAAGRAALAVVAALVLALPAGAHPAPWSHVDLRIAGTVVDGQLTLHVADLAHELSVTPAEILLNADVLETHAGRLLTLLRARFSVAVNGTTTVGEWMAPVPSGEGDSIRVRVRFGGERPVARLVLTASLFPYDPLHQTFVNVYEGSVLAAQGILDADRTELRHATGVDSGPAAVVREFVPSGIHHILIGPDHLLFLLGLLLPGGTWRRLALVVTAFTVAHSITLSLAALELVTPAASVIEPAIALSIVYVGLDNLLVRGGRDARIWIAFVFGLIHGFGFAGVLREMALPRGALAWSLASFNVGVEIGQLAVVTAVATLLAAIRRRSETVARRLAYAGSVVVIAAGTYWFVQRVFGT